MGWIYDGTPELDAQSKYLPIVIVSVLTTVTMLAVVVARFVLCKSKATYKWELALLSFAATCSIIFSALCIQQTRYGLGLDVQKRPPQDVQPATENNYIGRPFYLSGIALFKASLLTGYLRITARTNRVKFRRFVICMLVFIAISTPTYILINMLGCSPVRKGWMGPSVDGSCLSFSPTNYAISSINVTADIVTFSLPWFMVSFVNLNTKQRNRFLGAFALGFITTVFSGLRIWGLHFNNSGTGDLVFVVHFGCIEMNVGIIAACIPFILPKGKYKSNGALRFDFLKSPMPDHDLTRARSSNSGEHLVHIERNVTIQTSVAPSTPTVGGKVKPSYHVAPFAHQCDWD